LHHLRERGGIAGRHGMFPAPRKIPCNGIELAVYDQGRGPAIILLHGFPELAFSWRHQLPALAAAGFHAIAPDQRGYGESDVPPAVRDYRIEALIADVEGLLDALGLEAATFVGHDWGALLLWQMALRRPARIDGMIILNIPYYPRLPVDPVSVMRRKLGDDYYIVNFQDSDEADRAFGADPARFIDSLMRRGQMNRGEYEKSPAASRPLSMLRLLSGSRRSGEPLLNDEELAYYARAFERTGFTGAINWYRNFSHNWRTLDGYDERIRVPTLFIGAIDDLVVDLDHVEAMKPFVDDLELHMLDDCESAAIASHEGEDYRARRATYRPLGRAPTAVAGLVQRG
jgi:pimeloyl-ACP methyl ester carboxylesterase